MTGDGAKEIDCLTRDGVVVTLRAVSPADRDALNDFYGGISPDALRLRFFGYSKSVVARDIDRLLRPAAPDHAALVAVAADRIVGVGCWARTADRAADVALLVADDWHGHGIGTLLVERLCRSIAAAGIRTVTADVLGDNSEMLRVFHDLGPRFNREWDAGVVHIEADLAPTSVWRDAQEARNRAAEHAALDQLIAS